MKSNFLRLGLILSLATGHFLVFGQTTPTAHSLSSGTWSLTGWNSGVAANSYPGNGATGTDATTGVVAGAASANMVFWRTGTNDPGIGSTANANYTGAYNSGTGSRMNGGGAAGFSWTNTGTAGNLGIAVLRLNSTGRENIEVSWYGRMLSNLTYNATTQNRFYAIRLQYYVGTDPVNGTWTNVNEFVCNSSATAYKTNGTFEVFGPTTLPAACDNEANLYLRWQFYQASGSAGGRPTMGVDEISVSSSASASASISTSAITGSPFCVTASAGASVTVPFTISGTFNGGNVFTAQLSDAAGSFASPTNIGTLSSTAAGSISATIPAGTTGGTGYRIRVVGSNPATTGSDNGTNLQVILGPTDISGLAAGPGDGSASISWTNPTTCFDDVLVVASTSAIAGPPVGTSFPGNNVFGSGTALLGGFSIDQGSGTSATITGLTNGTTYRIKVFVRNGSNWSAGVSTTVVPQPVRFAFTQVGSTDPDIFEGILLKRQNVSDLSFTDNGICANGLFRQNEQSAETQLTGLTDVPAGTIVRYTMSAGTNDFDFSDGLITKFSSGMNGLSTGGDQVIAYTGTGNGASGCGGSGTNSYVAGINFGNSGWITTGEANANTSYAPVSNADFHAGSNTNYRASATITGTPGTILTALKTAGNWTAAGTAQAFSLKPILFHESNYSSGSLAFSAVTNGSFNVNWSGVTFGGTDSNTRFVVVVHTAAPGNPVDRTTCFTPNADFSSAPSVITSVAGQTGTDFCGTPTTGSGKLVYMGYGTSVNVTGLTMGTNYQVRVYAVNGNGYTANYSTTPTAGNQTTTSSVATEVSLVGTSVTVSEGAGFATVTVGISNPSPTVATTVQLVLTSGDAADVGNYTTQTITFPAGSTANQTLNIPITNDLIIEDNEVLVFTLQNPAGGNSAALGSNINFTLTIEDNDFPKLVINEVMYNNPGFDEEWIELHNWGTDPVVLSTSYTLENTAPAWNYSFPNTTIPAGGYLTIQVGSSGAFPFSPDLVRSTSANQLNNTGSTIRLRKGAQTFDEVNYAATAPWPTDANSGGPSLSLKHPQADNSNGNNWKGSCADGGTPGAYNGVGTLRSLASGNWPVSSIWQWKIEGTSTWTPAPTIGFLVTCQTDVVVLTNHTITIPSGHVASADDVFLYGSITLDNVATLNVSDNVKIYGGGLLNIPTAGGSATLNVDGDIDNYNGTLNIGNNNVVNITGDYIIGSINTIMGLNAVMNVADDWIFTGGIDNQPVFSNGTVNLMGTSGTQEIGTTTFNNLVMSGSAPKNVATGASVSIKNKLELQSGSLTTTAGVLTLKSDATRTAYLDNFSSGFTGTIAGPIAMERHLLAGNGYYNYVGSAVQSPNIATEFSEFYPYGTDGAQLLPSVTCSQDSLFLGSPYGRLFEWRENATPGSYQPDCYTWRWHVRSSGTLTNGMGLAAQKWGPNSYTMSVSGIPNLTNVTTPSLGTSVGPGMWSGWHMVANPFPSAWTWNGPDALAQGFDGQCQFFQATGPYQGQYLASVGPQVIASSQGFFIHRTSGSGTFTFPAAQRTTANPGFFSQLPWYEAELVFAVNGPNGADMAKIYFAQEATRGRDLLWDADKIQGSSSLPMIYTTSTSGEHLSINSQEPLAFAEHRAVPFGFYPGAHGLYAIKAESIKGLGSEVSLYLEDRTSNTFHNLRETAYTFNAADGDNTDRFVLHFNPQFTGTEQVKEGSQFVVTAANGNILVNNLGKSATGMLELLSVSGQRVEAVGAARFAEGHNSFGHEHLAPGVYVVKITTPEKNYNQRVLIY